MDVNSAGKVKTVLGSVLPEVLGITDAHNHVWIEPVVGSIPDAPVLTDQSNIRAELIEFHQSGGGSQVDCQPGGCGRNGNVLSELSRATRVNIIACTGYHLQKYYPPEYWLFSTPVEKASDYFKSEIESGLQECLQAGKTIQAGFIKIACQSTLETSPVHLMEAAAVASNQTGSAIEVHTEKGNSAETFVDFFIKHGVPASRLIICHIDKRPDAGLHSELARAGVMLEYDTFFRPKYRPTENVWPLIQKLCKDGFSSSIALATDLAEAVLWNYLGGGPGLVGFISSIRQQLFDMGLDQEVINNLTGGNINRRLAFTNPNTK
jgi:predicted metal-dependent phosphotriesterase family hydrolase